MARNTATQWLARRRREQAKLAAAAARSSGGEDGSAGLIRSGVPRGFLARRTALEPSNGNGDKTGGEVSPLDIPAYGPITGDVLAALQRGEPAPPSWRLFGYLRVSSEEQARDGLGLEVQRDMVTAEARARGVTVAGWYEDAGVSGTRIVRPGLGACLASLRHGDVVCFARLDRLARDLEVQELLLRQVWNKGATVLSCSATESAYCQPNDESDPMRRFVRVLMGSLAQLERDMIAVRTAAGAQRAKAEGRAVAHPRIGLRIAKDGRLVEDKREQEMIARARELREARLSWDQVQERLVAEGYKTRGGKPLNRSLLRSCFTDPWTGKRWYATWELQDDGVTRRVEGGR